MNDEKELEDGLVKENDESEKEKEPADESQKGAISSDLIRGHINTIILRTLDERDKYGYEIMNEIEEKSHGQYSLKQPTLYSALKRLESQGYIKAYWKTDEVSSGGRRKYFTLTELGREFAEKNQAEWEYSRTVIDSLISDRSFDFSQPAPTHVDFNLLKKSVSRVYTGGSGDKDEEDIEDRIQRLSSGASPAPTADPQSEFAKRYAEIESSPVKNEYSGQAVHDLFVEGHPSEEKKETEKPAEANVAPQSDGTPAQQPDVLKKTIVEQPATQQTPVQESSVSQQSEQITRTESAENTLNQQNQSQNVQESAPAQPYGGQNSVPPQYAQPPYYYPEGYPPQGYAPYYGPEYFNRQPYPPQGYDPYGRPFTPYSQQQYAAQPEYAQQNAPQQEQTAERVKRDLFATQLTPAQPADERSEEEKRIAHENFLKLIAEQDNKNTVPNSDEIDTDKLIYTNRPETERDYKNLVNNIFNKAIKPAEPVRNTVNEPQQQPEPQPEPEQAVQYEQPQPQVQVTQSRYNYQSDPAYEKAKADGLKINTSSASGIRTKGARGTTFNKGAALFASAVIVGVILLIEFAVCLALMQPLGIGIMYPVTLLILAVVVLGLFGGMYAAGYGRGSIRPATHGYISLCAVLTVIAILVVCLVSFLLEINLQSSTDIAVKLIIPAITALNITIFGVSYYFISK